MGMDAKCFFMEPTGEIKRWLRRYASTGQDNCPGSLGQYSYHQAMVVLDVVKANEDDEGVLPLQKELDHNHPLWPIRCEKCFYQFKESDTWQIFTDRVYRRTDNEEYTTLREAPPGAMWYADWLLERHTGNEWRGPDGHCLMIRGFYNRDFCPDQRAGNCGLPNDDVHKCWIRHGTPPNITVNKNGVTCVAGAGSFWCSPAWHGFCENGVLVQR